MKAVTWMLWVACAILPGAALAQQDQGVITGRVTDASGAVLPGATVTIEAIDTGVTIQSVTSSDGLYTQPGLKIGSYRVTAELTGFIASSERWDFTLGGACFPEKHPEAPTLDDDLNYLRTKVDAGASFLITQLFFDSVLRDDRSVLDLLTADYSFVNERIARHYGVPNVTGSEFRRVPLPGPRRGLLGQGSILLLTSVADRTSPVLRGKWIMEVLLGSPPPPPPPNVPTLPESTTEKLSMRARMERHRGDPACAGCHQLMDPIGLVLESYDGIGRWRTEDNGDPVTGYGSPIHVLRDFGPIQGPVELRRAILAQPERFVRTATEKLMTYALGRALTAADMPTARAIVRAAAGEDYRFSALVLGVVTSDAFQKRIAGADTAVKVALDSR